MFGDTCLASCFGLNWMYGFRGQPVAVGSTTAAQRAAHDVIIAAAFDLHGRLVAFCRISGCWRLAEL